MTPPKTSRIFSAMFLVAGTCIGGGMLTFPIATGVFGFFPSIVMMFFCFLAMTLTALLLSEVTLWMKKDSHIITMSSSILGPWGKRCCWILYLFIAYASLVAYTAGGGTQIAEASRTLLQCDCSRDLGSLFFILFFGAILYFGGMVIGRINTVLFGAMIGAYLLLIGLGLDEVKPKLLRFYKWSGGLQALPMLLTMFSFQTMVPNLIPYLNRDPKAIRKSIIGGTIITFLIYFLWQWLILGIVPVYGESGLLEALIKGNLPATSFLSLHVKGNWIGLIAEYFAFFAIITSFLGIGYGLFDFLSDGLKIKKTQKGKLIISILIILPTLFFATQFERVFILAMDATGGIGDTLLNGIIIILLVWLGRYHQNHTGPLRIPGGKVLLSILFFFFSSILILDLLQIFGILPSIYHLYDLVELHNPGQIIQDQ